MGNLLRSQSSKILNVCAIYVCGFLLPAVLYLTHSPSPCLQFLRTFFSLDIGHWALDPLIYTKVAPRIWPLLKPLAQAFGRKEYLLSKVVVISWNLEPGTATIRLPPILPRLVCSSQELFLCWTLDIGRSTH